MYWLIEWLYDWVTDIVDVIICIVILLPWIFFQGKMSHFLNFSVNFYVKLVSWIDSSGKCKKVIMYVI